MSYNLLTQKKQKGSIKKSKRVGRGFGSGKGGHTSGKGTKGQKAREGAKPNLWFEGGQTPIVRKLPFIYGFKRAKKYSVVNISLESLNKFSAETVITPEFLKKNGYDKKAGYYKLLGNGSLKNRVNVEGLWYTKKAKEKIEKVGGSIK